MEGEVRLTQKGDPQGQHVWLCVIGFGIHNILQSADNHLTTLHLCIVRY
jgi:hypothetical protein